MVPASAASARAVRSRYEAKLANATSTSPRRSSTRVSGAAPLVGKPDSQFTQRSAHGVAGDTQVTQHALNLVHASIEARAQDDQIAHPIEHDIKPLGLDPEHAVAASSPISHRAPFGLSAAVGARSRHSHGFRWIGAARGRGRQASAGQQRPQRGDALVDTLQDSEGGRKFPGPHLGAQLFQFMGRPRDGVVGYRARRTLEGVQMAKQGIHKLGVHLQGGLRGARQRLLRLRDMAQVLVRLVEKQAAQQLGLARVPLTQRAALAVVRYRSLRAVPWCKWNLASARSWSCRRPAPPAPAGAHRRAAWLRCRQEARVAAAGPMISVRRSRRARARSASSWPAKRSRASAWVSPFMAAASAAVSRPAAAAEAARVSATRRISSMMWLASLVEFTMLWMKAPMSLVAAAERSASLRTSSATRPKALPCTPAREASMAALSARIFVSEVTSSNNSTIWPISSERASSAFNLRAISAMAACW